MRLFLKWGLVLAGSTAVWTLLVHVAGFYTIRIEHADLVDRVVLVLPIVILTLALREAQSAYGGRLSFGRGVLTGALVASVAAPLIVGALWVYHHYINPEWLAILVAYDRSVMEAKGFSAEQMAARLARLESMGVLKNQIMNGVRGTVLMGAFLSAVITPALGALRKFARARPLLRSHFRSTRSRGRRHRRRPPRRSGSWSGERHFRSARLTVCSCSPTGPYS